MAYNVGRVDRHGQKNVVFTCLWASPNDSRHNRASFSTIATDSLCLLVTQMPRSPDLAIFVLTTDDRKNQLLYPLLRMRAAGNYGYRDNDVLSQWM